MYSIKRNQHEQTQTPEGCVQCRQREELGFDFEFAYQPIVDLQNRRIYAHEALVRGPHGEPSSSVLAHLTKANLYRFDQACRIKAIQGAARLGMQERLSINFMPNAVYRPETCIRSTLNAARELNFPIEKIIFEVNECEQIEDRPHLVEIFQEYKRLGFHTAIDDFGAGYAGLSLLSEFRPHVIKVDMQLVRGIDRNAAKQSIVKGIAAICSELGVEVLAEGIETTAERDFLFQAGISLMQGYLFCKPAFRAIGAVEESSWL
ncbi:EAL domain-containing protein [Undibacterium sp. TJN25]|uniref:EAL domain-containing protein n=1 Tax=Undibacterium sp. TJN25 TaxID=3413056 RepID=UPI003BEF9F4E